MAREYTTISVHKDTKKVLDNTSSTGQSANGQIKDLLEQNEGKTFKQLLKIAEEEQ